MFYVFSNHGTEKGLGNKKTEDQMNPLQAEEQHSCEFAGILELS
jgi:hypothetical protein